MYPGGRALDASLVEEWITTITNEIREVEGLRVLEHRTKVSDIARAHSENMASHQRITHRLDGKGPTDRALAAGYDCKADLGDGRYSQGLAENVSSIKRIQDWFRPTRGVGAWQLVGYRADEEAVARGLMEKWMKSDGHRENILKERYRRVGVGVFIELGEKRGYVFETVWATQNFSSCY